MPDDDARALEIGNLVEHLKGDVDIVFRNEHLLLLYMVIVNQEEINTILINATGQLLQSQRDEAKLSFERATLANSRLQTRVNRLFKTLLEINQPGAKNG